MDTLWRPSFLGRVFTRAGKWSVTVTPTEILVTKDGRTGTIPHEGSLAVHEGYPWSCVHVRTPAGATLEFDGLPVRQGRRLLRAARAAALNERTRGALSAAITEQINVVLPWGAGVQREANALIKSGIWVSQAHIEGWEQSRPVPTINPESPEFLGAVERASPAEKRAIKLWLGELEAYAARRNRSAIRREAKTQHELFERLEPHPLSAEQVTAALSLAPHVQVLAAAGSGKTSTLVARAAYEVRRGTPPEEIVLLAFNSRAAEELQERLDAGFARVGLPTGRVRASTFHSFALRVIREVTGKTPELPAWLREDDVRQLGRVASRLSARDPWFARSWQALADMAPVGESVTGERALVQLARTVMLHAKNGGFGPQQLRERVALLPPEERARGEAFATLIPALWGAWDEELAAQGALDFEDLLLRAAQLIRAGQWQRPIRAILVDEAQDASRARAFLVAALQGRGETRVLQVGDDWQSINRFAGADLTTLTQAERFFGPVTRLVLEETHRFPQALADISSAFIQRNPAQLRKRVRASNPTAGEHPPAVRIIRLDAERETAAVLLEHLRLRDAEAAARDEHPEVLILGRYRRLEALVSEVLAAPWQRIRPRFNTVHAVKGQSADLVIVLSVVAGAFPSERPDDPLLRLAMPDQEPFPYAEERRLMYVALTRAKQEVWMVTESSRPSIFVTEVSSLTSE